MFPDTARARDRDIGSPVEERLLERLDQGRADLLDLVHDDHTHDRDSIGTEHVRCQPALVPNDLLLRGTAKK